MRYPLKREQLAALFKVYPGRTKLFYHVIIWKHLKDMRRFCAKNSYSTGRILGLCRQYTVVKIKSNGRQQTKPDLGEVHLWVERIGTLIVSHEMTHAACGYLARKKNKSINIWDGNGKGFSHPTEEALAEAVGNLVGQFYRKAYHRRLYP